jgi:hypothetical protein
LTITHGDPDPIGGVPGHPAGVPPASHLGRRARAAAPVAPRLARWRTRSAAVAHRAGRRRRAHGPVRIRVLHPPLPSGNGSACATRDSVVLDIRIGDVSIRPARRHRHRRRAGDPAAAGARADCRAQGAASWQRDVKHAGPVVARWRPAVVIFSAGRNNRFAPAPGRGGALSRDGRRDVLDGGGRRDRSGHARRAVRLWSWRGDRIPFEETAAMPRYAGRPAANP